MAEAADTYAPGSGFPWRFRGAVLAASPSAGGLPSSESRACGRSTPLSASILTWSSLSVSREDGCAPGRVGGAHRAGRGLRKAAEASWSQVISWVQSSEKPLDQWAYPGLTLPPGDTGPCQGTSVGVLTGGLQASSLGMLPNPAQGPGSPTEMSRLCRKQRGDRESLP